MLARWSSSYLFNVWAWVFFFPSVAFFSRAQQAGSLQNVTIPNTDPSIDYTPFVCNVTGSDTFDPSCLGGWQVLSVGGQTIVSTQGAGPLGANIVPQMFLRFQALALFFTTSSISNATFNITASAGNTTVSVSANSSVGNAVLLNLPENETTILSLTFVPGQIPAHLDIGNITIEVTDNSSSSSFLPTQTLPPSVSLPTFIPSITSVSSTTSSSIPSSSTRSSSNHKQLVADAVGLTLGLGLGLTLFSSLGFYIWKRRRRRQVDADWQYNGDPHAQGQGQRNFALRRTENTDSTRWF
ncbi:hypothetical protein GYMLUDRAFT_46627 [Collybiopsis luxurians FD-317 M1]|uniref:Mid2 domain-containing protein n=1 Tax=Collybiopsis luxurians FD-317 M1 TaxID=944289 RepID=A0A0D0CFZ6_9AGAR|nr:hypothetical protein GYMLUDRAFT_46627 [Collybiopsis luxurians FD-317 M1]